MLSILTADEAENVCVVILTTSLLAGAAAHLMPVVSVLSAVKICPFVPTAKREIVLSAVPANKSPLASMLLMLGVVNTGEVKVLFVSVCAVVRSTVVAVSISRVTDPVVPPPDSPVPATTAVISPTSLVIQA